MLKRAFVLTHLPGLLPETARQLPMVGRRTTDRLTRMQAVTVWRKDEWSSG